MPEPLNWLVNHPEWDGILVGLVGFGLTLWQVRRSQTAAEAASRATTFAVELVRQHQFVAAASRLQTIAAAIDDAVADGDDRKVVRRLLNNWREEAMRVAGLYGPSQPAEAGAPPVEIVGLHDALRDCAEAIELLVDQGQNIADATQSARRSIKKSVEPIGIMGATLSTEGLRRDQ